MKIIHAKIGNKLYRIEKGKCTNCAFYAKTDPFWKCNPPDKFPSCVLDSQTGFYTNYIWKLIFA